MEKIQLKRNVNSVVFEYRMCSCTGGDSLPQTGHQRIYLGREAVLLNLVSYIKTECQELVAPMGGKEKRHFGCFSRLTLKIGQMENTSNWESNHRYV